MNTEQREQLDRARRQARAGAWDRIAAIMQRQRDGDTLTAEDWAEVDAANETIMDTEPDTDQD